MPQLPKPAPAGQRGQPRLRLHGIYQDVTGVSSYPIHRPSCLGQNQAPPAARGQWPKQPGPHAHCHWYSVHSGPWPFPGIVPEECLPSCRHFSRCRLEGSWTSDWAPATIWTLGPKLSTVQTWGPQGPSLTTRHQHLQEAVPLLPKRSLAHPPGAKAQLRFQCELLNGQRFPPAK